MNHLELINKQLLSMSEMLTDVSLSNVALGLSEQGELTVYHDRKKPALPDTLNEIPSIPTAAVAGLYSDRYRNAQFIITDGLHVLIHRPAFNKLIWCTSINWSAANLPAIHVLRETQVLIETGFHQDYADSLSGSIREMTASKAREAMLFVSILDCLKLVSAGCRRDLVAFEF